KENYRCTFQFEKETPTTILTYLLRNAPVAFQISKDRQQIVLVQQERNLVTVSGFIQDEKSGERLIGANIIDLLTGQGTASNEYGFFSLTLPEGVLELRISYLGYTAQYDRIFIKESQQKIYNLKSNLTLEEIVVLGRLPQGNQTLLQSGSKQDIDMESLSALPTLGGEVDVMRMMDMLPGVQSGPEGVGGLHVRGGNADQNLVLIDGVPIYNGSHLLGIYSMFNDFSVQKASLQKSDFDTRHGGRLSSVMDIRLREGNQQEYHGGIGLGLLTTKAYVEGPIQKGKSSFMVSGRRLFWDWLLSLIINNSELTDLQYLKFYFYDWNAKVNYTLSDKDRFYLSFFRGGDIFEFNDEYGGLYNGPRPSKSISNIVVDWDNTVLSARWNHIYNDRLFSNSTLTFSKFDFRFRNYEHTYFTDTLETDLLFFDQNISSIIDYTLKTDFDFYLSPEHLIKFGGAYIHHLFKVSTASVSSFSVTNPPEEIDFDIVSDPEKLQAIYPLQTSRSNELVAYIEDNYQLSPNWKIKGGLYNAAFIVPNKTWFSFQPRLTILGKLHPKLNWETSISRMNQFLHLVTGSNIGLPSDLWVPATENVAPQKATQVSSGINFDSQSGFKFSLEGYYKKMDNILTFAVNNENPIPTEVNNWEDEVIVGEGWGYGLESFFAFNKGKSTGQISYTLSWAERLYPELNNGKKYPFKYDRRHFIKTSYLYRFSEKFQMGLNWVYGTGNPFTAKEGEFSIPGYGEFDLFTSRNAVRLPAYHRADLSFNFIKKKKKGVRVWNVSIYNIYNHQNPFWIYQTTEDGVLRTKQLSILPFFPSFTYSYQF
ncbi:MAG: TonB-dependent receptor, partial [Saprospiraceae bacterium]|nr:TonB-dependent receptor [Saprospiraceae bacterium]